ncbi:hypothetical protein TIFTF001_024868 [Ficus carica]|uniref:Uncharacterized protein n=1 Tax=Ficus carica TaxID=3494 RepID=A0AA88DKG2_FICCA|nr:hypothetical protein TIFTF001_024868 [Ficus carica]
MMMREGTSGSIRCQDCGNQAKKECVYMRCRTCCKSKGFQCQTHVKSTWVPLYRRRQKQQQQQLLQQQQQQQQHELLNLPPSTTTSSNYFGLLQQGHLSTSNYSTNPKRLKENPVSSSSGLEDHHHHHHHDHDHQAKNFPAEVNAMATFHVVRVSSMVDDGGPHSHPHHHHHHRNHHHDVHHQHHQYAYQTSVSIGGHVFKGILYDQGPDQQQIGATNSSLGAGDQSPFAPGVVFQQPNLFNLTSSTRASGATAGIINLSACSSSPSADQRPLFNVGSSSSSYPIFHPPSGFMSGMQFFPNRKS